MRLDCLFDRYLPDQKGQKRKEEKLNRNEQDLRLFREPESCFHGIQTEFQIKVHDPYPEHNREQN